MIFVNRVLSLILFTACGNDFCKSCDESGCTECMEGYPASPDGQTCYSEY